MVSKVTFVAIAAVLAVVLCMIEAAPQESAVTSEACKCCEAGCDPATATGCSSTISPKCFQICQKKLVAQHIAVSPSKTEINSIPDDQLQIKCKPSTIGPC